MKKRLAITALALLVFGVWTTVGVMYLGNKSLAGQVVDAQIGSPVAGATVRLGALTAMTDQNGRYLFAGLQRLPDSQRLAVEVDGYYPQVQTVELAWWQRQAAADVRLRPIQLTGVVLDAWTEQPLSDALVEVHQVVSALGNTQTVTTDGAGRFAFVRLAPPVEVTVAAPGYLAWSSVINGYETLDSGDEWQVALTPNTITGTVRAADTGELLPSVTISLNEQIVQTDELGRFGLNRVADGATIQIAPPDVFLPAQVTYTPNANLIAVVESRQVTVTARDGLMDTSLPGTVVQTLGITRIIPTEGAQFTRVAPGTHLQLTREGYLTTEVTYNGESRLEVTMRPYALQGVVRDADTGQPLPGATLYAGSQIIQIDETGFYRLSELPNEPSISVKVPGFHKATVLLGASSSLDGRAVPCAQDPPTPGPLCLDLHLTRFDVRGLYIPFGLLSKPDTVRELLDLIARTELNALVVDVKGDRGYLAYDSQVPLAMELGVSEGREDWITIEELLTEAEARNIYTVARIVVFKDNPLAFGQPDLAVQRADGTVWTDGEGLGWGNPFREEVWDYNIAIAQEVAALGFDEVQFDYLRFPSDGDVGAITYVEENTLETRTIAIREFTRRLTDALRPYGVFTSADVFGLTVWVDPESDMNIGQRVIDVAPLVDYLCPMVYPATFRPGNLGYENPSAHPYEVVFRSQGAAEGRVPPSTRVRPWLQAYWYTLDEMLLQKQAASDANAPGWTFWNAGGVYNEELFVDSEE